MKKVKILLILTLMLIITGCVNKNLIKIYDKMKTNENMNGYSIDLRIYGKIDDKYVNKIIKIKNYNDESFQIREINTSKELSEDIANTGTNEDVTYVIKGKIYKLKNDKYTQVDSYNYTNPLIYLEGLKKTVGTPIEKEELIGENLYKKYEVKVKKSYLNKLMKEMGVNENVEGNESGEIYVDSDGYLNKIIYKVNDLTVSVYYFAINSSSEIILPN